MPGFMLIFNVDYCHNGKVIQEQQTLGRLEAGNQEEILKM